MTDNTVIVFPPDLSKPGERHTRANARDLVNGAGYTWARGVPTTPAGYASFATLEAPESKPQSQSVLDSVGSSGNAASAAAAGAAAALAQQQQQMAAALAAQAPAPVAAPVVEEVVDLSAPPVVDASDLDDPADEADAAGETEGEVEPTAEAEPAPRRRGRPPKNA